MAVLRGTLVGVTRRAWGGDWVRIVVLRIFGVLEGWAWCLRAGRMVTGLKVSTPEGGWLVRKIPLPSPSPEREGGEQGRRAALVASGGCPGRLPIHDESLWPSSW
jgi:hypothetical protein